MKTIIVAGVLIIGAAALSGRVERRPQSLAIPPVSSILFADR